MKKTARFIGVILLLFVVTYAGFTQVQVATYSSRILGTGAKGAVADFEVAKPGEVVTNYSITSVSGGVIFQATAVPAGNAVGRAVSIAYDPARADGQRLLLNVGGTAITTELYDWEIIPIARFVESGYSACMTLFDQPRTQEEWATHRLNSDSGIMWANFNQAFGNTLIGLNLFFVDAMFVNPSLIQFADEAFDAPILGYHTSWRNERSAAKTLRIWNLSRVIQILVREQNEIGSWNSYIYTDYGTEISYSIENNRIVFTGVPSYLFVKNNHTEKTVTVAEDLNERIIGLHDSIYSINPTIYRSAERTAQWAAFFRMVQAEYPQIWRNFLGQISGIEASPRVETLRYWLSSTMPE
jgi:hypothetical protein